eukprot:4690968-Prymnesium_polylepis.1
MVKFVDSRLPLALLARQPLIQAQLPLPLTTRLRLEPFGQETKRWKRKKRLQRARALAAVESSV